MVFQSILEHRLPAFSSVRLSVIGINNKESIKKIAEAVSKNGGVFIKKPSANTHPTHFLCGDEGTKDVRSISQEVKASGLKNVNFVWEEWLWDSLTAGGEHDSGRT